MEYNINRRPRRRIGIIGGAGPLAGSHLFEQIIRICQEKYHCTIDSEFPYCHLISYPFSDMLTNQYDKKIIEDELSECFRTFEKNDVSLAAISCNTLHAFLPSFPPSIQLIHMIEETASFIEQNRWTNPRILCSSTAIATSIHSKFFPCHYPDQEMQKEVDTLTTDITTGCNLSEAADRLSTLCQGVPTVLACTELTLVYEKTLFGGINICCPNLLVAEKICDLIFA